VSVTLNEVIQAWGLGDVQQTLDLALQYVQVASDPTAKSRARHVAVLALVKMERYEEARRMLDGLISAVDQQYRGHIWLPPITYVFRDERVRVCHLMNDRESRDRFLNELQVLVGEDMREYAAEFDKLRADLAAGSVNFDSPI